jgi:hypothetical protein
MGPGWGNFFGWNGDANAGTIGDAGTAEERITNWYTWWTYFAPALASGLPTWQAAAQANNLTIDYPSPGGSCPYEPWDQGREVWYGDLIGTFTTP